MLYNTDAKCVVNRKMMSYHMSADQVHEGQRRERYHHGDLRRDLLRVARREIARHGVQAVSLSSLARLAGVSQPAPYRHFADRDALLEAVAAEGFEEFVYALTEATGSRGPSEALHAIALAYLAFGESNIEIYRLMFASRLTPQAEDGSDLGQASCKAFDLLRLAISAVSAPAMVDDDAYRLWAQLHGLVMLKADGFIVRPLGRFVDLSSLLAERSNRTHAPSHVHGDPEV